ncbi:MAG: RdgB/HAM1 family non-canonical purine NTP pyrophosphatase [Acidobacteria bacterium]|nr:RdgB/HAM1 family non-canonical purine NTP pyrophosphatase [Acidobacteriota bacterium]
MDLLVATRNTGKLTELRELLGDAGVRLLSLDETGITEDVDENGTTFEANARLKASAYAKAAGTYAVADDSGLEVDALNGAPGIFSARYAGVETGFDKKMETLLAEMDDSDSASRSARFVCVMAFSDPEGNILFTTEGICSGNIAKEPAGIGGFGYDPIFIPDGYHRTFGELTASVKNTIGHRSKASRAFVAYLRDFIGV